MKKKGIPASEGIGRGKILKLTHNKIILDENNFQGVDEELKLFEQAINEVENNINLIKKESNLQEAELAIFDAHLMILNDPELKNKIVENINQKHNAQIATKKVTDEFINIFSSMDNEYFKERASDIKDIQTQILAKLTNTELTNLKNIQEDTIIVAHDLTPSDTAQLNNYVKGFLTEMHGTTSHSAIMARTLGIPAIVGAGAIDVKNNQEIIINGTTGEYLVNPTIEEIAVYEKEYAQIIKYQKELEKYKTVETKTIDNKKIDVAANIGSEQDLEKVLENGADGIGLFRTEFLFMETDSAPSEDEQFTVYKNVLLKMKQKPVVVRTLDIGGDKIINYLKQKPEMNPFLGNRAIRLCFQEENLFRTQLRALIRAAEFGNLKIMFPMIATVDEFKKAKAIFEEEKNKLKKDFQIEVGIMVEIPSTAMMADTFADHVDFMSIGTNDLIQYTMAADRMNEKVAYLYQPFNPAILRMIRNVTVAMKSAGKWSGMCGEMASISQATKMLVGLGLDEFSVSANSIMEIRKNINESNQINLEKEMLPILNLNSSDEVLKYINQIK